MEGGRTVTLRPESAEVIELLSALVAIDSVNPSLVPGASGETRIAEFVADWLRSAGLEVTVVEVAPGRPNVVARLAGQRSGPALLLNAHIDTVGVAGMAEPFTPRVEGHPEGTRLFGRGSYDMKGGLTAIMLAARRLAASGGSPGDILLTAVADEEYASLGTQAVVAGWTADAAIVTEPTGLRLCTAHKGFAWITIETVGRAAHGSRPDLGVDAIAHMGRILTDLESLASRLAHDTQRVPGHALLGTGSLHASLIQGGQELSSYPERCRLQVERRTIPGETRERVMTEINDLLARRSARDPAFSSSTELTFWREPFEVDQDELIVRTVGSASTRVTGHPPVVYGDTPWMDAALLAAAGIPTVVYGPGGAGAHAVFEYADVEEVATCAEVLALTAREFGAAQ